MNALTGREYDSRVSGRYPDRYRRTALLPAILAVLALLIGVALVGTGGFTVIRYIVSIFALIVAVFAWQARQWWWLIGLLPIAVLWNPISPIELASAELWLALQYVAALVFLAAGILIRVREPEQNR